jgi:hypothetical protein
MTAAASATRERSRKVSQSLGLPFNERLPELESSLRLRDKSSIATRALALQVAVACSYGYASSEGVEWLKIHHLASSLSETERVFLEDTREDKLRFQPQVECLFAFAWVLGLTSPFDWRAPPPENLVSMYPHLKTKELPQRFLDSIKLRSETEVLAAVDAAYCVHWGCRQLLLDGRSPPVQVAAVENRRRALEWSVGTENWDDLSLDS